MEMKECMSTWLHPLLLDSSTGEHDEKPFYERITCCTCVTTGYQRICGRGSDGLYSVETDILAKYKNAFESENPDIRIKWVRDSTGIMTAKLLAEKNNPRAEVVWGLAGSSMALLKEEGILQPYTPQGVDALRSNLNDPQSSQAWYGNDAFFNAVCFNEAVAKTVELACTSILGRPHQAYL